jgi:hypothetical protein
MIDRMRLADYWGDFVTFRNLEPADRRLRGLRAIHGELGLAGGRIPRKAEPDFAAVIMHFLHQAQSLRGAGRPLERLLYVGDTRMNDGTAAANLGQHLPLRAFIGQDKLDQAPQIETQGHLTVANRWTALGPFLQALPVQGFGLDAGAAALIDMDKTAIGARGRNDRAIDLARLDAVRQTVRATLGESFQLDTFYPIYNELNKPPYHPFTADNQDYLVYISLMVSAGAVDFDALLAQLRSGQLATFEQFVAVCQDRLRDDGLAALRPIHEEIAGNMQRGDPTPFKSFRYREYKATVARMNVLPDDSPPDRLLAEEITVTREVAEAALRLRQQGVLLFGLSDKPDEASVPGAELAGQGYQPLHRTVMKVM